MSLHLKIVSQKYCRKYEFALRFKNFLDVWLLGALVGFKLAPNSRTLPETHPKGPFGEVLGGIWGQFRDMFGRFWDVF